MANGSAAGGPVPSPRVNAPASKMAGEHLAPSTNSVSPPPAPALASLPRPPRPGSSVPPPSAQSRTHSSLLPFSQSTLSSCLIFSDVRRRGGASSSPPAHPSSPPRHAFHAKRFPSISLSWAAAHAASMPGSFDSSSISRKLRSGSVRASPVPRMDWRSSRFGSTAIPPPPPSSLL